MIKKYISPVVFLFIISSSARAQQTVGLFLNDSSSFNGYTLMSPNATDTAYLLDNCGEIVHHWITGQPPAGTSFIRENGDLLTASRIVSTYFNYGGSGGQMQEFDWSGNTVWAYKYASPTYQQHHDFEVMPNGNILILSWDLYGASDAIAHGRDPSTIASKFLSEKVVELKPIGIDSAEVVWEWKIWDHLIQDFDSTKLNYGVVGDHPELLDMNYLHGNIPLVGNATDWLHMNSVRYNAKYDQIFISARNVCELYVIDHSTTTAQAASHTGGTYGHGGDFLYRFGNTAAYRRGDSTEEMLYGQHDPRWIPDGYPNAGKISVFNNQTDSSHSQVNIFTLPMDSTGHFDAPGPNGWGPFTFDWTYAAPDFYSQIASGAQPLPNGNMLICEAVPGHLIEVTPNSQIVWDYINPVGVNGPVSQGNTPQNNIVFRALRFAPDYAGFDGRTLTPTVPVELNPLPSTCVIYIADTTDTTGNSLVRIPDGNSYLQYNNPIHNQLDIHMSGLTGATVKVFTLNGEVILQGEFSSQEEMIDASSWSAGMYLVQFIFDNRITKTVKVVKE